MDFDIFSVARIQIFFIIFSRVVGFFSAIPTFSSTQVPYMAKAALSLTLSLCLFPVLEQQIHAPVDFTPLPLALFVVSEFLIGALLGLVARLIFVSVQYGGTIIGFQMGFSAANIYDPQNQTQVQLISQFQNIFAIFVFLAINGHFVFFKAMVVSFSILPPGPIDLSGGAVPYLMQLTSHMFVLGLQFSAPVLTVLLLSGLILGILARVFPQLNVFMLSFPINIGISFLVIGLTLGVMFAILRREFDTLPQDLLNLLHLLR